MPNIEKLREPKNIGRELTNEEIEMVAGGSVREGVHDIREGIRDIHEGVNDLRHGNPEGFRDISEGVRDIREGVHDIVTAGHRKV